MKQSKKYIIIFKKNSKWLEKSEKHNTTHCKEIINHQQTRGHTSTTPSTTAQHTPTEEQRHEVCILERLLETLITQLSRTERVLVRSHPLEQQVTITLGALRGMFIRHIHHTLYLDKRCGV